jgi:hypothetical protein
MRRVDSRSGAIAALGRRAHAAVLVRSVREAAYDLCGTRGEKDYLCQMWGKVPDTRRQPINGLDEFRSRSGIVKAGDKARTAAGIPSAR